MIFEKLLKRQDVNCDAGEVAFQTEGIEGVKSPNGRRLGMFKQRPGEPGDP